MVSVMYMLAEVGKHFDWWDLEICRNEIRCCLVALILLENKKKISYNNYSH